MTEAAAAKIVCITGASSGIGRATAVWFAKHKYHIVTGARRHELLTAHAEELEKLGAASVLTLPLDVRSREAVNDFCAALVNRHPGGPDILVNNAGLALGRDTVAEGKDDDWIGMMETNVLGVLWMTRAILKTMLVRKSGHIVMVGSIASHQVYEGGAVYCASKFGARAIAETMRMELLGTGIRLTTVDPGMVETEFSLVRFQQDSQRAKAVYAGMEPLKGEDVAECIGFAVTRPPHVNLESIMVNPTDQANVKQVYRRST